MQIMRLLACAAALSAAGGCATIIRGTEQDFAIESSPPGAEATLSTGQSCVTPCTLHLPRKTDFDVTFNMEGYETGTAHVTSGWSRGGTQTFVSAISFWAAWSAWALTPPPAPPAIFGRIR